MQKGELNPGINIELVDGEYFFVELNCFCELGISFVGEGEIEINIKGKGLIFDELFMRSFTICFYIVLCLDKGFDGFLQLFILQVEDGNVVKEIRLNLPP